MHFFSYNRLVCINTDLPIKCLPANYIHLIFNICGDTKLYDKSLHVSVYYTLEVCDRYY